jgi:DNA polymerase-3 subunit delta'
MNDGPPHPRKNSHLAGHGEAEQTLLQAYNSGRLPHAWLITGPAGIGKATLAFRFARFVLARANGEGGLFAAAPSPPDSLSVVESDPVFQRVASGGHADFMGVERSEDPKTGKMRTVISVDQTRGIGKFFSLTAAEGGWRVVVIDSADEMNRNAANAALKVLEEPPAKSLLILVSHNPGRLLPTIRSRCRRLTLNPLADETVAELLTRYHPEAEDVELLSRLASGSIGRALSLAEEGGLALYHDLMGLLESLPELDTGALHGLGQRAAKSDTAFHVLSDLLQEWLGRLILFAADGARQGADPGETALMERLSSGGLEPWLEVWEKVNRLLARADKQDRMQVVLNVFFTMERALRF